MHPSARHSISNDFNSNNNHSNPSTISSSNSSNHNVKSVISNAHAPAGLMNSNHNSHSTAGATYHHHQHNSSSSSNSYSYSNQNNNASMNKQIKIGNYILGATIGKGNSAVVKLATHSLTRQKVAIKIFDKNGLDNEKQVRLRREIDSMKQLKHQHIIKLYEIMETSKLICLVTEYASNGELYNHILRKKRLSEREARSILKQIVAAVHFCHYNQIVHRDIKVENLLLDANFRVKLADFGFSAHFDYGDLLDVWCGSPPYCAPELYLARPYDGPKVDIWSLGVVLYVLVCGYLPFEAQSFNLLKSQVVNGAYKLPFFLSEDCKNLINGILEIDPKRRFSMEDIINHRWLKFDNDFLILPQPVMMGMLANENDSQQQQPVESILYQEFRKLIAKIEKISIKDLKIDENILKEINKYGIDPDDVITSIRSNEFDSNAGIYFLLESKYANQSDISSSSSGQHIFRLRSEARSDDVISNSSVDSTYESSQQQQQQACKINVFGATDDPAAALGGLGPDDAVAVDEDEDEDDGGDQMIEELGRQYLNRHNSIRRHTIGTNTNDAHSFNSDLMKSTECLPMLNEANMAMEQQQAAVAVASAAAAAAAANEAALLHEAAIRNSLFNSNLVNGVLNNSLLNSLLINSVPPGSHSNNSPHHLSGAGPPSSSFVKELGIFGTKTQSQVAQHLKNHLSAVSGGTTTPSHLMAANNNNSNNMHQVNPFMVTAAHQQYASNYSSPADVELLNAAAAAANDSYGYGSSLSTSPSSSSPVSSFSSKQQPPPPAVKQKNTFKLAYQTTAHAAKQAKLNSGSGMSQQHQYLSPPNIAGRRASDGGSNISLFNQFYSLKNPYGNNSNIYQSNASSSKQSRGSITSGIPIFNMNNNPLLLVEQQQQQQQQQQQSQANTTICEMANPDEESNECCDERSQVGGGGGYENSAGNRYSFGAFQNRLNRVASLSSEDDDANLKTNSPDNAAAAAVAVNPNSITRFHRKSKSRHEPYLDPSGNSSTGNILSSNIVGKLSASKSREQSISGSGGGQQSVNNYHVGGKGDFGSNSFSHHRASEPNPLDLIFAHRAHLEKIYNQSVKQSGGGSGSGGGGDVSLAKELKLLQQENPSLDERTKVKLQNQHENVMNNFSLFKMRASIDAAAAVASMLNSFDRNSGDGKFQIATPKSSLSSTTSEESTSNGGSFSSTLRNNSTSPTNLALSLAAASSDITLMLNNNLDAISLADQPAAAIISNSSPSSLSISDFLGGQQQQQPAETASNESMSQQQQQQQLSSTASNQLMNSSALQMIQEEQNEIVLISSPSASMSSSASITPRMSSSAQQHFSPGQGSFVYNSSPNDS